MGVSTQRPFDDNRTLAIRSRRPVSDVGKFHESRGLFLLGIGAILVWMLKAFLMPLAVGAIFAVVLHPVMVRLERWIRSRTGRASIITLGFVVAFLIPIGVLGILGAEAALEKVRQLQADGAAFGDFSPLALMRKIGLESLLEKPPEWIPASEEQLRGYLLRAVESSGLWLSKGIQDFAANLPGVVFGNVVVVLAMFSFLVDGPRAVAFLRRNSFFSRVSTDRIFAAVGATCQATIVATLATGAVQAMLVGLACALAGVSNILPISLLSFAASFVPVIGTAPITITLAIAAFVRGDATGGLIFLAAIVVVGLSDNFVRPLVLKGGSELHPLVAFIAAFGGLEAMGFFGLFVGPVIAALFFAVLPIALRTYSRARTAR